MTKWLAGLMLVLGVACTAGEAPPTPGPVEDEGVPAAEERPAAPDAAAEERGAELLAEARLAYEAGELEAALERTGELLSDYRRTTSGVPALWLAARASLGAGLYADAERLASEYASEAPTEELAAKAEEVAALAADAQLAPQGVAVIGAVLPRTGPTALVRYGDWILEGIELAIEEAERSQGRRIDLVVADDAGGLRLREAVREVERQGALAVLGPLLPEHVGAAASARSDPGLVMISPTATETPTSPGTYSVNAGDGRGAQELGRYAADVGFARAALLYPRLPAFEQKARAFAVEFEERGGEVRAFVPYDSGTTTFESHMERILEAMAPGAAAAGFGAGDGAPESGFALFVAAPDRDVPQIAPQVSFYGLDSAGVQVFGDEAWAGATARRLVPRRDLEGVIAASRFPPDRAQGTADPEFVHLYEQRYRRSLQNQLPAFGYDAANMALQALPSRRLTPAALARRFEFLAGIRGATGLLSVRGQRIVRTPYLVIIRDGALAPAPFPWEYRAPAPADVGKEGGR